MVFTLPLSPFGKCLPGGGEAVVEIAQCVSWLAWLLSLYNMHLSSFHFFQLLDSLFPSMLKSSLLSGCITVCLSIRLLKDTLVNYRFNNWK